jgi:CspA family cold shock protein
MTATTAAEARDTEAVHVTGTVQWFSHKGFGFIRRRDGEDVYVHHSGIAGTGFRTLSRDARVRFSVRQTPRGPEAVDVVVMDEA